MGMEYLTELIKLLKRDKLSIAAIKKYFRPIAMKEFENSSGQGLNPGDSIYNIVFPKMDRKRKDQLEKYFSDLVLRNHFYLVIDKNGKPVSFFGDKP